MSDKNQEIQTLSQEYYRVLGKSSATVTEAAKLIGMSIGHITRLITYRKTLPARKVPCKSGNSDRWLIELIDLARYVVEYNPKPRKKSTHKKKSKSIKKVNPKCKYKGVSYIPPDSDNADSKSRSNPFRAIIQTRQGQHIIAMYHTEVEAARAYDSYARRIYKKECVVLNFPEPGEESAFDEDGKMKNYANIEDVLREPDPNKNVPEVVTDAKEERGDVSRDLVNVDKRLRSVGKVLSNIREELNSAGIELKDVGADSVKILDVSVETKEVLENISDNLDSLTKKFDKLETAVRVEQQGSLQMQGDVEDIKKYVMKIKKRVFKKKKVKAKSEPVPEPEEFKEPIKKKAKKKITYPLEAVVFLSKKRVIKSLHKKLTRKSNGSLIYKQFGKEFETIITIYNEEGKKIAAKALDTIAWSWSKPAGRDGIYLTF